MRPLKVVNFSLFIQLVYQLAVSFCYVSQNVARRQVEEYWHTPKEIKKRQTVATRTRLFRPTRRDFPGRCPLCVRKYPFYQNSTRRQAGGRTRPNLSSSGGEREKGDRFQRQRISTNARVSWREISFRRSDRTTGNAREDTFRGH